MTKMPKQILMPETEFIELQASEASKNIEMAQRWVVSDFWPVVFGENAPQGKHPAALLADLFQAVRKLASQASKDNKG